jgi:peptidoglycan hydrolase-like protein with peptidoglycan-binding domain
MGINKIGQSNPDVVALQTRLIKDGFLFGAATGYFGPATKAAVIAYQKKHGLSPLGVIGPATRNLLNQGI